ncbi:diguanylate cyclase domain-containing protein [Paraburkholderia caledonica]|uniref:Diguanylate cyclase (GGDEF)-like protein n=1 Tax=Paraburkholderia caledonica TaxID=134536 RepID=A0ABU1KZD6_9BURK|nr:diguanylate cyclase [Paraburkholderia caledonica]MDR6376341.1 diguanylate cyclase (GGDEF)-like protein [Paraburkholderia caledonica]
MAVNLSVSKSILATPPELGAAVSPSIRARLLATLFDNRRPLLMSVVASAFVAAVAYARLHQPWAILWLLADAWVLLGRLSIIHAYTSHNRNSPLNPRPWAATYAPLCLTTSLMLGLGTMGCVGTADTTLASLALMVASGILGGVASRNASVPRLAIAQICLVTIPIGLGALFSPIAGSWILVPPLLLYVGAMISIVQRHYRGLVALMIAEQNHAELAVRFDAALTHMPHGLCTIDRSGKVAIANSRTAQLFGATLDTLKLNVPLPEFIGHLGFVQFGERLGQQFTEKCSAWLHEKRRPLALALPNGRQLELTRNPVPDGSAVVIIEDVTERKRSEAKVLYLARHDSLTGLANRRELRERLGKILSSARRGSDTRTAVLYLDLDGFKQVNDRHGHTAGDEVLEAVATRLTETLRHGEFAARLGGDEFAVIVENAALHAVVAIAERVIREIAKPYPLTAGGTIHIGTSIGIALAEAQEPVDDLIRRADEAMYSAKKAGKGTYRISHGQTEPAPDADADRDASVGTA